MYQRVLTLSRAQWLQHGRIVCVPNSEARDVIGKHVSAGFYSAFHVFSEDQTVPVEQSERAVAA